MFTSAAERLGRDVDAPPLVEAGPIEVQRAAAAFNQMQTRLQALLRDRLQMLAALSHDLRTPITRLKLRAELIDDEQQQRKILADLSEIQSMVEASLAFARDETSREADVSFDLAVLLQTVCEEAEDSGGDAKYDGPDHAAYVGRPQTLKRAFANLVDNAVKYGGCARAMLEELPATFRVTIDDDGPGIPTGEIDKVFTPFIGLKRRAVAKPGVSGLVWLSFVPPSGCMGATSACAIVRQVALVRSSSCQNRLRRPCPPTATPPVLRLRTVLSKAELSALRGLC